MLPKGYRLPKQNIKTLFQTGKRVYFDEFKVFYQLTKLPNSRFLIILHTGKSQNSVMRHHVLRLIREEIQKQVKAEKTAKDIILLLNTVKSTFDEEQFQQKFKILLAKILQI